MDLVGRPISEVRVCFFSDQTRTNRFEFLALAHAVASTIRFPISTGITLFLKLSKYVVSRRKWGLGILAYHL